MTLSLSTLLLASPANEYDRSKNVHAKKIEKKVRQKVQKRQVRKVEKRRHKAVRKAKAKRDDRYLRKRHANRRHFRHRREYERLRHQRRVHRRDMIPRNIIAYRHYNRVWYRGYLYERLPFYDRYGYFYGYFNQIGYFFEGIFYRYDRHYTYRDRLRGRGLFDPYYYRPFR